jgi:methionyl-tRNA formyltransferase
MGTPEIASTYLKYLIDHHFNIIGVYSQPPRQKDRGMNVIESSVHKIAKLNYLNIFTPIKIDIEESKKIEALKPDLILIVGYGIKLPDNILRLPQFGCINVHFSLLPRWRGAAPVEHALLNGDKKTGVTIFKLDNKMDAGPIIISKSIKIEHNMNKEQLMSQLNIIGINLLEKILPKIFDNKISYQTQDESKVTYANKIFSKNRKIDFFEDIEIVQNKIRAFAPSPAAWFSYKGERIKIIKSKYVKGNWKPSSIINNDFHIGCKLGKIWS